MINFILDENGEPQRCTDTVKWSKWFQTAERHLGNDVVKKNIRVSTVFLGSDHSWGSDRPILWETMIFGGKHDGYQERYASKQEALAGHQRALSLVNGDEKITTCPDCKGDNIDFEGITDTLVVCVCCHCGFSWKKNLRLLDE